MLLIMNDLQRFLAVCMGEKPDYYPIFGFNEAPGVSGGVMRATYDVLRKGGMPDVGGVWELDGKPKRLEGWRKYWGVTSSIDVCEFPGIPGGDFSYTKEVKDGFEYVYCETGAKTKQIIDNDIKYSMPEFMSFHVRDWESWEFYKGRRTPKRPFNDNELEDICKKYRATGKPVRISLNSTFGTLRDLVGPLMACTIFYDEPDLARDILNWLREENKNYYFPLMRKLKPNAVVISEDICFNHGMFISPEMFKEFMMEAYIEMGEAAKECGVCAIAVDTDGYAEDIVPLLTECGVNAIFPWEVKSNNDINRVRQNHPELIIMGGLEKEVINSGNSILIKEEIIGKVPKLLEKGRYFPNIDHGIQPLVDFESMCKFMTLLHEICKNPEGDFPRLHI